MRIVIDAHIPFINGVFEPYANVVYLNGKDISNDSIKDADALVIRTRTKCNRELLYGTKVRCIATATIGTDHIDLDYCKSAGITVTNAAGCNAGGVMQYVFTALYGLAIKKGFSLPDLANYSVSEGVNLSGRKDISSNIKNDRKNLDFKRVIGIIGVGNVGSKVADLADYLGFEVLRCDPLKEREQTLAFNGGRLRIEEFKDYYSLDYLLENSDIVTMHTWLDDATFGMANSDFFAKMKEGAIFINASRGEVVDDKALLGAISRLGAVVIDVWNGEPNLNLELLESVDIATPHIAGYSFEGKINGTEISVRSVADFFNIEPLKGFKTFNDLYEPKIVSFEDLNNSQIYELLSGIFPIFEDDFNLRSNPESFEKLRSSYNYRREFYVKPTTKTTDC